MGDIELVLTYMRCGSIRETARLAGAAPVSVHRRLREAERLLNVEILERRKVRCIRVDPSILDRRLVRCA